MSTKTELHIGAGVAGWILILVVVALVYSFTVARFAGVAGSAQVSSSANERIKPVGQVQLAGSAAVTPAAPAAAAAAPTTAAGGGEATYNKVCLVCHGAGVAGAPKLGDKEAWAPRIAQGNEAMLKTAIAGKGAMPPRGTCATCSDDELKAAIEFMVSKAQ